MNQQSNTHTQAHRQSCQFKCLFWYNPISRQSDPSQFKGVSEQNQLTTVCTTKPISCAHSVNLCSAGNSYIVCSDPVTQHYKVQTHIVHSRVTIPCKWAPNTGIQPNQQSKECVRVFRLCSTPVIIVGKFRHSPSNASSSLAPQSEKPSLIKKNTGVTRQGKQAQVRNNYAEVIVNRWHTLKV